MIPREKKSFLFKMFQEKKNSVNESFHALPHFVLMNFSTQTFSGVAIFQLLVDVMLVVVSV